MRKNKVVVPNQISILTVDDDPIITDTIQDYFRRSGYQVDAENNPEAAVERVRDGKYDILLLDFLMSPICGDKVVEQIREFNQDLFIVLLTGHKSMAPPVKTIRQLDIQGYYEKNDRFDQLELLVESCVKSIKQMRVIREYEADLSAVVQGLPAMYQLQQTSDILQTVLAMAGEVMPYIGGFVKIEEEQKPMWQISGDVPFVERLDEMLSNADWETQSSVQWDQWWLFRLMDAQQGTRGVMGFLTHNRPGLEKRQLLKILARQAGAVLANHDLHRRVNRQNEELAEGYMQTIETLRYVVETRDRETEGHSARVSALAVAIAREQGVTHEAVDQIRVAGLFHDIGKVGVPDAILLKNGRLTEQEYAEIKKHPTEGERILKSYAPLREVLPIVRWHHERYDGKGYPDGLAGKDICLGARIIAVADSFDAMISNRTYRPGLDMEKAIAEMQRCAGTQWDPEVVETLLNMIQRMGKSEFRTQFCAPIQRKDD